MKEAVKMWANNNREAKSILNYYYACGATLDGKPYDDSDVVYGGYYMYENRYITRSERTDYEYYSNQENKEIFFATPVELEETNTEKRQHHHYFKSVKHLDYIDVYRTLSLFNVTDSCLQHAIKKLLVAGGRGAGKDIDTDIQEAIDSLTRWKEMRNEDVHL